MQTPHSFNATLNLPVNLGYWRYLPPGYADDLTRRWPLLVFLHGFGERGDGEADLRRVLVHGPPKRIQAGADYPCIVVAPQCPADSWWAYEVEALDALLATLLTDLWVDASRVYCTGLSMGGFGTWAWAVRHPHRFAAIAPICGGGLPALADHIRHLPTWVFHGDADDVVPLAMSQAMVKAQQITGGDVRFTVYPGVGHDSWTQTYDDPALMEWLLQQQNAST
jgi:predicted peptidase